MAESKNIWIWAAAALLCTTIGVSYLALSYQSQNVKLQADYEALFADFEDLESRNDNLIAQVSEAQNAKLQSDFEALSSSIDLLIAQSNEAQGAKLQADYEVILENVEDLTGSIDLLIAEAIESQDINLQVVYEALLDDVEDMTINIDLLIDYGDGNNIWLNNTKVPKDLDLLKALELVADVEYTPSEFGAFVTKVDGVGGDSDKFWLWFYYDTEAESWTYGPSGADLWVLHDGDIVSWEYTAF